MSIIVSICMITYNHEKYLNQAIDGILMQETNFDFELIIANDNSPDNSDSIIKNYINNHPLGKKIKYLKNEKNIGMMPNFIQAIENCTGKYVALCEGDDYWTDIKKLQKQVDFLENNQKYVICFHHANIDKNGSIIPDNITRKVKPKTSIKDLSKGNYIHTCTVLFRNHLFEGFPEYFYKAPVGDYFLHMLNSKYGKIFCIEECMANYRVHETSYWSSKKQEERVAIWIEFIQNIKPYFNYKTQYYLQEQIEKHSGTFKKKNIFEKIFNKIKNYTKDLIQ